MGPKAMEMLRLIPGAKPVLTDRCSGHGGKWGIFKQNFEPAEKVGRPAARAMAKNDPDYMVREWPPAGPHTQQVMELSGASKGPERSGHTTDVREQAYGRYMSGARL